MLGVGAGLGCGAAALAGLAAAVAPCCSGESLCHSLHFGLVARIAAPRLADWELANLVAQPPAKVAQPPAKRRLCRYGLSLLPRNFLRAVLVRTRLTAFELSSGLNVGGELTGGELTGWLPTSLTS